MSITEKLNKIKSCKEDIKQAIIDKGVDMTGISLEGYATKISEIQAGGGDYLDVKANLSTYYSTTEITPAYAFAYMGGLTSVNLPNCVSINEGAFTQCSSLQSVNIPMCGYVGNSAFFQCKSLTSIDLPNCSIISPNTFASCTSLTTINLPKCEFIGGYAFQSCIALQSIYLPNLYSLNGQNHFNYCSSLQSIYLPRLMNTAYYMFASCSSLSEAYMPICCRIDGYTFQSCTSLSVLDLRSTYSCSLSTSNAFSKTPFASGIGSIYVHAAHLSQFQNATNWTYFSNCLVGVGDANRPLLSFDSGKVYGDTYILYSNYLSYLNIKSSSVIEIDLPYLEVFDSSYFKFAYYSNLREAKLNNIKSIKSAFFSGCTSLTTVNLPMCEYVDNDAFHECVSLTSIDLPNCSYVGSSAFRLCTSLQSANLPKCEYVGNEGFNNCSPLQSIYLPNCSYVGDKAFNNCFSLSTVNLPMCEYVGSSAFANCSSLQSVNLPMCSYVNYYTFEDCKSLQSLNLPNCYKLSNCAFYGCRSLSTIYIGTSISTVCEIKGDTFTMTNSSFSVFVPMSLVDAYKSALYWSNYASQIFGI